jgi:hypothetical protein
MSSGNDARRQWHVLHAAGIGVALAMRLLPRRSRFRAALLLARAAEPFFRRTAAYDAQSRLKIDGSREIALYFVTAALTANGTEFDPLVTIDGYDGFARLCRAGGGVLLVQPHALLTHLQFRTFHDDGLAPVGVNADAQMRLAGTKIPADLLVPSPTLLVRARSRLREGRLVCAMIDRAQHFGERTVEVETVNGPVILSRALLDVAVRCGARVAFTDVHVEGSRVIGTIAIGKSDTAAGLMREFAAFVRERLAARSPAAAGAMQTPLEEAQ